MKFQDRRLRPTRDSRSRAQLSKVLCESLGLDIRLPRGNDRMLSPTKFFFSTFLLSNSKNSFSRHVMASVLLEANQRRK